MMNAYSKYLPSHAIHSVAHAARVRVARSTVEAYVRTPAAGVDRYAHAAKLNMCKALVGGSWLPVTALTTAFFGDDVLGFIKPSFVGTRSRPVSSGPTIANLWLGLGAMVIVGALVGVGPAAAVRRPTAHMPPTYLETVLEYGFIGRLEPQALDAAARCAQRGEMLKSYAAQACAVGVALGLECIRLPYACALVVVQLVSAVTCAVFHTGLGLVNTMLSSEHPANQYTFEKFDVELAAGLLGQSFGHASTMHSQAPGRTVVQVALADCAPEFTALQQATDTQAIYALLDDWTDLQPARKLGALSLYVGAEDGSILGTSDSQWVRAVTGADVGTPEAKQQLRKLSRAVHPDKLIQRGDRLDAQTRILAECVYATVAYASSKNNG